jgi:hypothetical protein
MQQDELEVTFCDLCGASVPAADLTSGAAVKHQEKIVGACCLGALRPSAVAPMRVEAAAVSPAVPAKSPHGEGRLLLVGVVVLVAIAAATIFLDQRITSADTAWREQQSQLALAQRSDSEVLQSLALAMDGAARRADVDALGERLVALEGAVRAGGEQARQGIDEVAREAASVRQEVRTASAATIDYRPLFDDLRDQLRRQGVAIAALRSMPQPAPVEPVPAEPTPDRGGPGSGLAPHLAEQVETLQQKDPAIRFEAVDELLRSKDNAIVPFLLPMANDPDAFVRRLTVEGLRDFRVPEVVDVLLVGLGDSDENVRDTAWRSLREVTGQRLPFEATASKDARARAQQKWQEWWEANRRSFGS